MARRSDWKLLMESSIVLSRRINVSINLPTDNQIRIWLLDLRDESHHLVHTQLRRNHQNLCCFYYNLLLAHANRVVAQTNYIPLTKTRLFIKRAYRRASLGSTKFKADLRGSLFCSSFSSFARINLHLSQLSTNYFTYRVTSSQGTLSSGYSVSFKRIIAWAVIQSVNAIKARTPFHRVLLTLTWTYQEAHVQGATLNPSALISNHRIRCWFNCDKSCERIPAFHISYILITLKHLQSQESYGVP